MDTLSPTAVGGLNGDRDSRDTPREERYISRRELRQLLPVSDMTIWRWQHDPQIAFPTPVKLGTHGRNFWWLPAIRDWARRRAEPAQSSPTPQRGVAS